MVRFRYLSKKYQGCMPLEGYCCCRQLRFSLYSGAVITKALAVVVPLYYPLVSGSLECPMPLAWHCGCILCCVSLPFNLTWSQLCLSKVLGFCSLFYSVPFCNAPWDSLFGFMHSGIVCLASQAPDWTVAFWDGLSGL